MSLVISEAHTSYSRPRDSRMTSSWHLEVPRSTSLLHGELWRVSTLPTVPSIKPLGQVSWYTRPGRLYTSIALHALLIAIKDKGETYASVSPCSPYKHRKPAELNITRGFWQFMHSTLRTFWYYREATTGLTFRKSRHNPCSDRDIAGAEISTSIIHKDSQGQQWPYDIKEELTPTLHMALAHAVGVVAAATFLSRA